MTSNQRRPGFRLPWASETEESTSGPIAAPEADEAAETTQAAAAVESSTNHAPGEPPAEAAASSPPGVEVDGKPVAAEQKPAPPVVKRSAHVATTPARTVPTEASAGFMRDLVAAMRRVAEETRQTGLSDLRAKAEEQVRSLEADAERRREELKARAETDVAGVGEWAAAETERIKQEAEQRVVARRAQLDQQLAGETSRAEAEAKTLNDRVADYDHELDAYHAQLSDIADPAAFAAAAKRMPAPPRLDAVGAAKPSTPVESPPTAPAPETHPAEEEVLTSRLAELDAVLEEPSDVSAAAPESAAAAGSTSTEILVKGLGSFGAITGFRQALASVDGIEGVSLSLGPTGEFVFRAIHQTGFDVTAAIAKLEGDAATIEPQGDGGLRVTLDRAR